MVSDKELKRLLDIATCGDVGKSLAAWRLLEREVEHIARELLAARKVVRAAPKLLSATTTVSFDDAAAALQAALAAYDKARRKVGT